MLLSSWCIPEEVDRDYVLATAGCSALGLFGLYSVTCRCVFVPAFWAAISGHAGV